MALTRQSRIDPEAGSYRGYRQDQSFDHDLGLIVLPVASRASAHKVIKLHGGYATRSVTWVASRVGSPPMIPAASNTIGDTLLSATVQPSLPIPDSNSGGYSWTVQGQYLFVQTIPRVAGVNAFPAGQHPYLPLPQSQIASALVANVANSVDEQMRYLEGATDVSPGVSSTTTAVTPLDTLTEEASRTTVTGEDGSVFWPFTALPAFMSSTHIIGG